MAEDAVAHAPAYRDALDWRDHERAVSEHIAACPFDVWRIGAANHEHEGPALKTLATLSGLLEDRRWAIDPVRYDGDFVRRAVPQVVALLGNRHAHD